MQRKNSSFDVLIVGCGPAGLSAAIYTGRAQLSTAIFGDNKKSNLFKSHTIANYFGFPDDTTGPELSTLGLKQALKFGASHFPSEIVDIVINDDESFTVKDDGNDTYTSKTIILATGQSFAHSGIQNEKELVGKGISYCPTCDGFLFKEKEIVVIGNGNLAAEDALQLLNYTNSITVLSHGKEFDFSSEMKKELEKTKIKLQKTPRIKEMLGNEKVEKLVLEGGEEIKTSGVFMAIGTAGATIFAKKLGLETEGSYLKINQNGTTNIKGVFAAGDCCGSSPQVATSVGNGCNAALSAIKLIRNLKIYIQYN